MARRNGNVAGKGKAKGVTFRGFVQHSLTKEEKLQYDTWVAEQSLELLFSFLERLVDSHYKLSAKNDSYGGGVQISLTCDDEKNLDAGLVMTSRAPDLYNGLMLAMFKHLVLFGGEWNEYAPDGDGVSAWG